MKKHIILPITLAAMMILGGCAKGSSQGQNTNTGSDTTDTGAGGGGSSEVAVNSVSITNKDALTAEWFAGEAVRKVAVAADPEIEDINDLLDSGALTITSSNAEVVAVNRLMLSPVAAGTATITVNYGGKSDSVEITVSAERTAKEIYGSVHAGTAEDPFDNADACLVAPLAKAASDTTKYYIKGTVLSFYHAVGERSDGCVSWYLDNGSGAKGFECYKILKEDGSSLTNDDIWVGAEVVVKGALTDYNGQAETDTGIWVENTGNGAAKPQPQQTIVSNVADAVTVGKALEDGASSYDKYEVTGYIAIAEGTNFWIADEKGSSAAKTDLLELYLGYFSGKYVDSTGAEVGVAAMLVGAKVKATMTLKNYHGQIENGVMDGNVTVLEAGEAPAAAISVTVSEACTAGYALEAGATSSDTYIITGKVVSKGSWSSSYNNANFVIADDAAETDTTKQLTVFRYADQTIFDSLAVGDTVKVTSKIQRYVKNTTDIIETLAAPEVEKVSSGESGGGETPTVNYGTAEAPLTITEAKAILDSTGNKVVTSEKMYVKGIVESSEYSTKYSNYTVWLQSEDGATAQAFELYASVVDSSITADYTAKDALRGKEVVCYGYGELYNTTYELTKVDTDYPTILSVSDVATVAPTSISLNKSELNLDSGAESTLTSRIYPANNNFEGDVVWSTSDSAVATVANGVVKAIGAGEATITATAGSVTSSCTVKVSTPASGPSFTLDATSLGVSSTYGDGTKVIDDVTFAFTQVMSGSNGMQLRNKNSVNSGFANTSAFSSNIAKVVVNMNAAKATNSNNDFFEISFSSDGSTWSDPKVVNTVANTTEYTVTPDADSTYFKLVHIGGDGSSKYTGYYDSVVISTK